MEKEQQGDDELTQDDYLFQQPNGDPMVPCPTGSDDPAGERSLPVDLNVHSLRHTNASMLIAGALDVRSGRPAGSYTAQHHHGYL